MYGSASIGNPAANVEALSNGSSYYFVDTTNGNQNCYNTTVIGGNTIPAYQDSYGYYYRNGTGDNVYGTMPAPGNEEVLHDNSGYYYMAGGTTKTPVTTADFTAITATAFKPTAYTAPTDASRPVADTVTANSSLASLTTSSRVSGTSPTTGVPVFENVINYGTTVPTMTAVERQEYASVANTTSYTVQNRTQDGYASGTLSNVNIDNGGVVYGIYSNGKTIPLYQIALYDFQNHQGLYREGGNLFSATNDSGEPQLGVAGDNGFGKPKAYNIEQSNVDMTTEFVQMISTQRGFQANSKGITTVDTMLETVIGMKR